MYSGWQMQFRSDALNAFTRIMNAMKCGPQPSHLLLLPIAGKFLWGLSLDIFNIFLSWQWESLSRHGKVCTWLDYFAMAHTLACSSWSCAAWVSNSPASGKI